MKQPAIDETRRRDLFTEFLHHVFTGGRFTPSEPALRHFDGIHGLLAGKKLGDRAQKTVGCPARAPAIFEQISDRLLELKIQSGRDVGVGMLRKQGAELIASRAQRTQQKNGRSSGQFVGFWLSKRLDALIGFDYIEFCTKGKWFLNSRASPAG